MALVLTFVPDHYDSLQWTRLHVVMQDIGLVATNVRVPLTFNGWGYFPYLGTLLGLTLPPLLIAYLAVKRDFAFRRPHGRS